SHLGKPVVLGLPVLAKFNHEELITSANFHASSVFPVQSALKSTVLKANGISKPWKDPLEASSTPLFHAKKYAYRGAVDCSALASNVLMVNGLKTVSIDRRS